MQYAILISLISAVTCSQIAKARRVKAIRFWLILAVFFGPISIPFIFLAKKGKKVASPKIALDYRQQAPRKSYPAC